MVYLHPQGLSAFRKTKNPAVHLGRPPRSCKVPASSGYAFGEMLIWLYPFICHVTKNSERVLYLKPVSELVIETEPLIEFPVHWGRQTLVKGKC